MYVTPVNIMIADDHLMVREGLKQLLESDGNIKVIGQADDGLQCIELAQRLNPDVILLDVNMPKLNGIKTLEKLREMNRKDRVLILTIHNEIEYLLKTVEIGVNGYILKDSDGEVLKKAIFAVFQGETYIDPIMTPILREKLEAKKKAKEDVILTNREIEVLKLVAEGLFNKEIALELKISEKTVKNHISNIFKKIDVSDRTQAAVYAIKNNFVDFF